MLKKRICAVILSIMMVFSLISTSALAEGDETGNPGERLTETTSTPQVIKTADGDVEVSADWIEAYPFGTFAFGSYQSDIAEKGALTEDGKEIPSVVRIPVYRLGGTSGRVTAKIVYTPAVTLNENGTGYIFDYAASGKKDIIVRYENPKAIATYQQIGMSPKLLAMKAADGIMVVFEEPKSDVKPEDELKLILSGEVKADSFYWQAKTDFGWQFVKEAEESFLPTTWNAIWDFDKDSLKGVDYRCIYELDGALYCTDSLLGETYKEIESVPQLPEGFSEPEEPDYTELVFEGDYDSYEFDLTFSDGETVKYIEVESLEDETAELPEFGLFSIVSCVGGEISDVCNTHTVMVSDNDAPEASEISFDVGEIRVDRNVNTLCVTVVRTGGKNYNVSFDYETVDGTAKAGVDYARKTGTISLVGSIDRAEIPIEMIDVDTEEDRAFTLKISNLKGGGKDDICKTGIDEVTIIITGKEPSAKSDDSGKTLATVLNGSDGDDLTGKVSVDKNTLISDTTTTSWNYQGNDDVSKLVGEYVELPKTRSYSYYTDPNVQGISFSRKDIVNEKDEAKVNEKYRALQLYWTDWDMLGEVNQHRYIVADGVHTWNVTLPENSVVKATYQTMPHTENETTNQYYGWTEFSANKNGSGGFTINNVGKKYYEYIFGVDFIQFGENGSSYLRPTVKFDFSGGSTADIDSSYLNMDPTIPNDVDPEIIDGGKVYWFSSGSDTIKGQIRSFGYTYYGIESLQSPKYITWSGVKENNRPISFDTNKLEFSASFAMCKKWNSNTTGNATADRDSVVNVYSLGFRRRAFSNSVYPVIVYTANDYDEVQGGWAQLASNPKENSIDKTIYEAIRPEISLKQLNGGVNDAGNLYVGTVLQVDCSKAATNGFYVTGSENSNSVQGVYLVNSKGKVVVTGKATSTSNVWDLELLWDDMTIGDLEETYSIHVAYDRQQPVVVDIASSIPEGKTHSEAFSYWFNNTGITIGYGVAEQGESGDTNYVSRTETIRPGDFYEDSNKAIFFTNDKKKNVQWVCFNQDANDVVLFKGHAYRGDEKIAFTTSDLASDKLVFSFYDYDFLDTVCIMVPIIDHVELYYDGDCDDKISGTFEGGIFTPSAPDEYIGSLSGEYYENKFKPVVDSLGTHQYFAKIIYTMRPRAYKLPKGADENERAQVLPAFKSAITDDSELRQLTPEQKDLRYVKGGNTDNHVIYGEKASALSYIDVPLGGDTSDIERRSVTELIYNKSYTEVIDTYSKDVYEWNPKYVGSLLFTYDHPKEINNQENVTQHYVPYAGETATIVNETCYYTEEGLARINGYLGSFAGRSTIVIAIQEQSKTIDKLTNPDEVDPESTEIVDVVTIPNKNDIVNVTASTNAGDSSGSTPPDTGFDEFGANLGVDLPSLEFGFGDYATLVMEGNQIGFTIGLPLYKKESTGYEANDKTTTADGSTISKYTDDDGTPITETTMPNGNKKTTTETKSAPDADGKYQVTRKTVIEKPDGTKGYYNCITTYKDVNGNQVAVKKEVNTNEPPAETPKKTNGFKEANGQMATLGEFIGSIVKSAKGQQGSVKDFMKGAFEDDTFKNAMNGRSTSKKVSFSLSVQLAIMFEYNDIDNCHYFKSGALSASAGFEFTLQYRFAPIPVLYVYVKTGISIEIAIGLSVDRRTEEIKDPVTVVSGAVKKLKEARGESVVLKFAKDANGFSFDLTGSVYVEIFDKRPGETDKPKAAATLSGRYEQKEVSLAGYDGDHYVRMTSIGGTAEVTRLTQYEAISDVYFDGLSITPSISIEAGIGIGIELLKVEFYLKTNIAITITFGQYRPELRGTEREYDPAYVSSFDWSIAMGFNVTVLFINYSMDLIALSVHGSQEENGGIFTWEISATAIGGNKTLWTKTTYTDAKGHAVENPNRGKRSTTESKPAAVVSAEKSLVRVSAPTDITSTQKVNAVPTTKEKLREIIAGNEQGMRALTPQGTQDFELSGYGTSGEARLLVSGLTTGYTYKLFEAGNENYVIYPLMIDDVPQLVMSKIIMIGDVSTGTGFQNPIEPEAEDPYIMLDADGLADYDFDVDVVGEKITAVWTAATDSDGICVKRTSIDLDAGEEEFAEPTVLSSGDAYRYLPNQVGDSSVYVQNSGSAMSIIDNFKEYLIAKNQAQSAEEESLTAEVLDAGTTDNVFLASPVYRYVLMSELAKKQGSSAKLVLAQTAASGTVTEKTAVVEGETIENIAAVTVNGKTYVAYTTTKGAYFDGEADAPETVSKENFNANTEYGNIRSLYIREVTKDGFGTAKLLQTIVDFDDCTSDNIASAKLKDGVYVNNSLSGNGQADPYYSNLKFVTAQLELSETAKPETFLLFEMGGNTYMVRDIAKIFGSSPSVTMTPIFRNTSGTDVTIGSDGTRLAVVYTAPMKNTVNNAIFVAWWDAHINGWGQPEVLAMRHLQIYEDSITYEMSPEDTEKAYLGKINTPFQGENGKTHTGSMSKLTFGNLQMSTHTENAGTDKETKQLLVLTEGSIVQLQEVSYQDKQDKTITTIVPVPEANSGNIVPVVNFYAIAFGAGEKAIGEGILGFANYDFTSGNSLVGELDFRNVGTTAIRADDEHPITVTLSVSKENDSNISQTIAKWLLDESIPSGGKVHLTFTTDPLMNSLPVGTVFSVSVEENQYYAGQYHDSIGDLFKVESKPELQFSRFNAEVLSVENEKAVVYIDSSIVNVGNKKADKVFIQFTYDTGKEGKNGQIYLPIDISENTLRTSESTPITRETVQKDLKNGVYELSRRGNGSIEPGYQRNVTGTINVPIEAFVSLEDLSGLHLHAEIYSNADNPERDSNKVFAFDHAEYNSRNNAYETTLQHTSIFKVPTRIVMALGNTMRIPAPVQSTSKNGDITVSEVSNGSRDWQPLLGIAYYDSESSTIVLAANDIAESLVAEGKKASGILQIQDMATNSLGLITFTVKEMGSGINIFKDDDSFTYYNADGSLTDTDAPLSEHPGWGFSENVPDVAWKGGATANETPMNNDLSWANEEGAYLTFQTTADTLDIYFEGSIEVVSDTLTEAEGKKTFTNPTGNPAVSAPASLNFENEEGVIHTITIKALKEGTQIDRYMATYRKNPVVPSDREAPQILWNRSFPDTASVLTGESVPMRCYILDNSGLSKIVFDGTELSDKTSPKLVKTDDGFWYFDYEFTKNGVSVVRAYDTAGNTTKGTVRADWFNSVLTEGAIGDAPELTQDNLSFVDDDGNPVSGALNEAPWLASAYALGETESSQAFLFVDGEFSDAGLAKDTTDEKWKVVSNGYYMVQVNRENGSWARGIVKIEGLDLEKPQLSVSNENGVVNYTASDNSAIVSLTINGYAMEITGNPLSGTFDPGLSGEYTVVVTDDADNTAEATVTVTVDLAVPEEAVATKTEYLQEKLQGSVTIDPTKVLGGTADLSISDPENGVYKTAYSFAVVAAGTDPDTLDKTDYTTIDGPTTIDGLAEGEYEIYVRDNQGNRVKYAENFTVYHPDDAWTEPTYAWTTDGSTVTASRQSTIYPEYIQSETVATVGEVVTEATCETDGSTKYTATFTKTYFTTQTETLTDIPATGHAWGEIAYQWSDDLSTVTAVHICQNDTSHVESETVDTTNSVTKVPTCEGKGETTYVAEFTNTAFTNQVKTIANIDALGHDWGEWAETKKPTSTEAGEETHICKRDETHIETREIPPLGLPSYTFTKGVSVTWVKGSEDGAVFVIERSRDNEESVQHLQSVAVDGKTVDAANYTAEAGLTLTLAPKFLEKLATGAHTIRVTYDDGFIETNFATVLGKDWSVPEITWSENNATATMTRYNLSDPSVVETEIAGSAKTVVSEPTCEQDGEQTFTVVFQNAAFGTQVKSEAIPALGHAWGEWTVTKKPTSTEAGAETHICARDNTHTETREIPPLGLPSYTFTKGVSDTWTKGSRKGQAFTVDRSRDAEESLQHFTGVTVDGTAVDAANYVAEDSLTVTLKYEYLETLSTGSHTIRVAFDDGYIETYFAIVLGDGWSVPEIVWSEDHKTATMARYNLSDPTVWETEVAATTAGIVSAATCETDGITKYTVTFQNPAFGSQTCIVADIPALGHEWGEWTVVTEPTDTTAGVEERVCKHDQSHKETKEIPTISYIFVQGAGAEWDEGSGEDLILIVKRSDKDEETFGRFQGIFLDGEAVDPSNYTAVAGSVKITVKRDFLKAQTTGNHEVTVQFVDGSAKT
ncbi:MAG: hypothetical protein IJM57_05590, partial [Lachnospiraceae bacterium]|nr:hypothetical protein [Lachnospiraceae bacterium]